MKEFRYKYLMDEYKRCRTKSHDPEIQIRILDILSKLHNRTGKSLKKEYVREFSIRHHKKLLRLTYKPSPRKYQALLSKTSAEFRSHLTDFASHAQENKPKLMPISQTTSGPETDGKSKRNLQHQGKKSFNDFFVRDYFSEPVVKDSYFLYMNYMFANMSPDVLCENFRYTCCKSENHSQECVESWSGLKDFFFIYMFKDLDDRFSVSSNNEKFLENKSERSEETFREIVKPEVRDQFTQAGETVCDAETITNNEGRRNVSSLDMINSFGQHLMSLNFAYIQLIANINK
jgi:hypothetical protein